MDGAHAGAQFPFKLQALGCDSYGVSLRGSFLAPFRAPAFCSSGAIGCAPILRRSRRLRPRATQTCAEGAEEIGTAPAATRAAICETLELKQAIDDERKAARLPRL